MESVKHPVYGRFKEARIRRQLSHNAMSSKLDSLKRTLSAKQLKSLEEANKVKVDLEDIFYIIRMLGANADFLFPTAYQADELALHTARCLAKVLEEQGVEEYFYVIDKVHKSRKELTENFTYEVTFPYP